MKVRVIIEPDEDVYVTAPGLPGCVTYGKLKQKHTKILRKLLSCI